MKPVTVTYTGGIDEVSVLFPSGDYRTVKRGESIDVLPTDAASLSTVDWDVPKAKTTPATSGDDQ